MFSEVFLVQIRRKLQKIHSEVYIQSKNTLKNAFQILKLRAKKEIQREKSDRVGKRKFPSGVHILPSIPSTPSTRIRDEEIP
jgi:hypothetical protein